MDRANGNTTLNYDLVWFVGLVFNIFTFAIIGRALLSWIDPGLRSRFGRILVDVTEPIIGPIRRAIPSLGALDISPIIAILLLQILRRLLIGAID